MTKKKKILLIDDQDLLRQELKSALEHEGYDVTDVASAGEALLKIRDTKYDVICTDLVLKEGSGLDVLREAKKPEIGTEVIIFTGSASLESSISALNRGAFAYITKPFSIEELVSSIEEAVCAKKERKNKSGVLKKLIEENMTDELTGLFNRRYLNNILPAEMKRCARSGSVMTVVMMDIDMFKAVNDVYGHTAGDELLEQFADLLEESSRKSDILIRLGGDEFVVILPDTGKLGAESFAGKLLLRIKEKTFKSGKNELEVGLSLGIACYEPTGDKRAGEYGADLLEKADQALMVAKTKGGNAYSIHKEKERAAGGKRTGENRKLETYKSKIRGMVKRNDATVYELVSEIARKVDRAKTPGKEQEKNVLDLAVAMGKSYRFNDQQIDHLKKAMTVRDIGETILPRAILCKKGKLGKKEREEMEKHPEIAAELLKEAPLFKSIIPSVRFHHEKFDGTGYSAGLKGKDIPLGARIVGVLDTYEALISGRCYREAYTKEQAISIIKDGAGTQFDPDIVDKFISVVGGTLKGCTRRRGR
ncbi:MAG: diguanylate cyclase [Candidatus Omnitrophica bacterium]|nr:diguanylate cyclase [Candidatus Omnitrophota bacterium]MDD5488711.1 diguanylate cyclase [Candidatus Omnitrophota bacterium]